MANPPGPGSHPINRRLSKTKTFNDAVHGVIELHPLSVRIIDTVEFQRLRDLKQLGGAYTVYPSASHNRFEHSLGVAHLARSFVRRLAASLQTGPGGDHEGIAITEADMVCVEIAGLIHDLGHGILSHMFDQKYVQRHYPGTEWEHEHASVDMFEHLIRTQSLRRYFEDAGLDFEVDVRFIQELVLGKPMASHPKFHTFHWSRGNNKRFLYEIVANKRNGIDVDKWDYFQRDAQALGLATEFNLNAMRRLMMHARVMFDPSDRSADPVTCIAYDVKVAKELYGMFRARAHLHMTAYQHRVSRGIEVMYCEALIAAENSFTVPGEYTAAEQAAMLADGTWAAKKHEKPRRKMHEAIHDMSAYSKLSDWVLKYLLTCTDGSLDGARKDEGLVAASKILKRIHRRFLYKFLMEVSIPTRYSTDGDDQGTLLELGFLASQLQDAQKHAEALLAEVLRPNAVIERSPAPPGSASRLHFKTYGQSSSDEATGSGASLVPEEEGVPPVHEGHRVVAFTIAKASAPRVHERRAAIRNTSPPRVRLASEDPAVTDAAAYAGVEEPAVGEEDTDGLSAAIAEGLSQLPVQSSSSTAAASSHGMRQSNLSFPPSTAVKTSSSSALGTVSKPPTGKGKPGTAVKSGSASAPPSSARHITDFFTKAAQVAERHRGTSASGAAAGGQAGASTAVKAGEKRGAVGFAEDVEVIEPVAKRERLAGSGDAVTTPARGPLGSSAASSSLESSSQVTVPETGTGTAAAAEAEAPLGQVRDRGRAHPGLTEKDVKWVTTWIITVANGMTEPLIRHAEAQYQSYQEEQEALLMEQEEGLLVSPLDAIDDTASTVPGIPSARVSVDEEDSMLGSSQPYPLPLSQIGYSQDDYSQPVPLSQMPGDYSSTQGEAGVHPGEAGAAGRGRSGGRGLAHGHATGAGSTREPIVITEADFFVDLVNIDYGKKGKDPIEDVVAFSVNKGGAGVRPVKISRKAQGEMVVPQVFRQQFIRIYSKRPENRRVTAMVHAAFVWFMEKFTLEPGLMPYYTPSSSKRSVSASGAAGAGAGAAEDHGQGGRSVAQTA